MGTNISGVLSRQRHGAEDGDEDEDRGDFEGQQQVAKKNTAEIGGSDQSPAAELRIAEWGTNGEKDVCQDPEQRGDARKTDEIGGATASGALFFARVQQHDDEGEEHHNGARVDDD